MLAKLHSMVNLKLDVADSETRVLIGRLEGYRDDNGD